MKVCFSLARTSSDASSHSLLSPTRQPLLPLKHYIYLISLNIAKAKNTIAS